MKKGKVFVLTFVLLLALAVPTAAMAMENGNGGTGTGHSVDLLMLGNWHYVNEDGSLQPMTRQSLTDGLVIKSGQTVACDEPLRLSSAIQCTFNITCSSNSEYAVSVTKLRLYEGSSYIGAFYRAGSDLKGQLIKTFNSGDHSLAIQNEGSETMIVTGLDVTW